MFDRRRYLDTYAAVLRQIDQEAITRLAQALFRAWEQRRTVFLCGNGGSAATASHLATDLVKLTAPSRGPRLRAVALGESASAMTAVANDFAYERVFVEQLVAFMAPHDLVVGLSTSGSSPNVLRAIEYARANAAGTIGITGLGGLRLQACAHECVVVPSTSVQHIEDATMVVGHLACLAVRDLIAASDDTTALPVPARPALQEDMVALMPRRSRRGPARTVADA